MSILSEFDKKLIKKQFNELCDNCPRVTSKSDKELIRKAFKFANEAHKNMKRKSGEPYIFHPIATL